MRIVQSEFKKLSLKWNILGRTWTPRGKVNEQLISEVEVGRNPGAVLQDLAEI